LINLRGGELMDESFLFTYILRIERLKRIGTYGSEIEQWVRLEDPNRNYKESFKK
jgi:hypothetical protein